jgi:hypothetical protein
MKHVSSKLDLSGASLLGTWKFCSCGVYLIGLFMCLPCILPSSKLDEVILWGSESWSESFIHLYKLNLLYETRKCCLEFTHIFVWEPFYAFMIWTTWTSNYGHSTHQYASLGNFFVDNLALFVVLLTEFRCVAFKNVIIATRENSRCSLFQAILSSLFFFELL